MTVNRISLDPDRIWVDEILDLRNLWVMGLPCFCCATVIVSSISIGGSISSEGFLSSILLSMVIIVTVVIVVVILIVVVDDVSLILKLSFGSLVIHIRLFYSLGWAYAFHKEQAFIGGSLGPVFLLGLSAFSMAAACASRAVVKSAISCRRASNVMVVFRMLTSFGEAFFQT
ncbi:hypothetical protein Tco_0294873 [Tanacetum coccineum]